MWRIFPRHASRTLNNCNTNYYVHTPLSASCILRTLRTSAADFSLDTCDTCLSYALALAPFTLRTHPRIPTLPTIPTTSRHCQRYAIGSHGLCFLPFFPVYQLRHEVHRKPPPTPALDPPYLSTTSSTPPSRIVHREGAVGGLRNWRRWRLVSLEGGRPRRGGVSKLLPQQGMRDPRGWIHRV